MQAGNYYNNVLEVVAVLSFSGEPLTGLAIETLKLVTQSNACNINTVSRIINYYTDLNILTADMYCAKFPGHRGGLQ